MQEMDIRDKEQKSLLSERNVELLETGLSNLYILLR